MLDDATLIERARDGDAAAFRMLVERYAPRIAPTVIHMLGVGAEADEIGQEVFVRFYQALGQFRGETSLEGYLHRIAVNLSLNALKLMKRWHQRFISWEAVSPYLAEPLDEAEPALEAREHVALVHHAIQRLRPKLRAVAVLRLIQEHSTRETADLLNIPVGTVLSRLSRAQAQLRTMLKPYLEE